MTGMNLSLSKINAMPPSKLLLIEETRLAVLISIPKPEM